MDHPPPLLLLLLLLLSPQSLSSPISISMTSRTLPTSGSQAHIHWSGFSSPTPLDWVGIYSPPDSDDANFIGYLFLSASPTHLASGSGNLSLPLVNLRSPYQFRLFRWSKDEIDPKHHDHDGNPLPGTRRKVAVSGDVGFEVVSRPEQVHLAFTERENEMRVLFVTAGGGGRRWVEYGTVEGRLEKRVEAEVSTYERKDMCDSPANKSVGWRDPGFVHDGVMKGLEKGKRYYYRVGNDEGGWSPIHSFISRDNNLNETVAFLFGDMGTYAPYSTFRRTQHESKSTVKWILRDIKDLGDKPSFVSHIGDISYARGYSWLWDEFFNQIEPIASRVPYHVSIGNHEYDWPQQPWRPSWSYSSYNKDGGGECGVPYSIKFHMPGKSSLPTGTGAPDTRNLYYSFDAGVVHFLYMSSETEFLPGSAQYNFIKHDLVSVNRDKTPYIVVQGHRPMYTTSNEKRDAQMREKMLESLEPLLVENSVTLALWGHVHRYERFCPLKNYTCLGNTSDSNLEKSTVHIVIGMAGQEWQPIWTPRPNHPDIPIFPQPERSLYRGGEFGYTRLVATWEKLTLTYIGNHDGLAHDTMEILSGRVLKSSDKDENGGQAKAVAVFTLSSYLKYAGVLLLGVVGGYALGFLVRCRRDNAAPKGEWTPVKMEEL